MNSRDCTDSCTSIPFCFFCTIVPVPFTLYYSNNHLFAAALNHEFVLAAGNQALRLIVNHEGIPAECVP